MKARLGICLWVLIFSICLAIVGVGCDGEDVDDNKIVVGLLSWPGDGPIYIGKEKGFFKEEGINLEVKLIESYDSRRSALIANQIDIDCNTLDQLLIYAENKFPAMVFGISDFSNGGDGIISKVSIGDIKQLKNKKVAFAEATPSDFFLRYILAKHGMTIKDIYAMPVSDAQAAGLAIIAEKVDAGVTYEPWLTKSRENKNLRILETTRKYPHLIPGLFIARKDDLNARRELYKSFMKAWYRSVQYYEQYREESIVIMAKKMGLDNGVVKDILSKVNILGKKENMEAFDHKSELSIYNLIEYIYEFWRESGFVKRQITFKEIIWDHSIGK